MVEQREQRLGTRTVLVLGLGTIVLAIVLAVVGTLLGNILMSLSDRSGVLFLAFVVIGIIAGFLGSRWPLPFVVLAGAVLQQGIMMVLLFTGPTGPDVDGDPAAYTTLPWNLLIQSTYAATILVPLVLSHVGMRAWRRPAAGASPGP